MRRSVRLRTTGTRQTKAANGGWDHSPVTTHPLEVVGRRAAAE
jgi:hypothetical protein